MTQTSDQSSEGPIRIAVIGGTGFGAAFGDSPSEIVDTEHGQAAVRRIPIGERRELLFLARHGAGHSLPPHRINYRANIAALRDLGVHAVFATAAAGSLRQEIEPGEYVILNDFIDLTKGEVVTFYDRPGQVTHIDFSAPYDARLRAILLRTVPAGLPGRVHERGTYLCLSGPRYETPAEVRLFASWGADVVGMTNAPEAILCREAGLPYAAVAVATNYGCGIIAGAPLSHTEVEQRMAASLGRLREWILRAAGEVE